MPRARRPHLELFRDKARKYRWRVRASNGLILASSEAYSRKGKAWETMARLAMVLKLKVKE